MINKGTIAVLNGVVVINKLEETMKKYSVIDNSYLSQCYTCGGVGSIVINENHPLVREQCTVCNGTGQYKAEHFIIVDEVNKIAIDSDSEGK